MFSDDDFDEVWGRMADSNAGQAEESPEAELADEAQEVDLGPPIRVTIVVKAEQVPVAPWAQGWQIAAAGPIEGHITMLFEHDIDADPVSQLAAITGLLSTIKSAKLDLVWWTLQTRGPIPDMDGESEPEPSLDQQLADFLISQDDEATQ